MSDIWKNLAELAFEFIAYGAACGGIGFALGLVVHMGRANATQAEEPNPCPKCGGENTASFISTCHDCDIRFTTGGRL